MSEQPENSASNETQEAISREEAISQEKALGREKAVSREEALSRETALRIALASRAISEMTVPRMLEILQKIVPGPISEKSLKAVTLSGLRNAVIGKEGNPDDLNAEDAKSALAALRGEFGVNALPEIQDNSVPLDKSIRVAIASNDGETLNGHFGSCARFLVYDLNVSEIRLVDIRSTAHADKAEDKNAARSELISDCSVIYMISIGGPAAAKVIRTGIYPIKQNAQVPAREALEKLQTVMAGSPPPWLAKLLGDDAESRVRFSRSDIEVNDSVAI